MFSKTEDIFVIGDIHGCVTELEALINLLPLTKHSVIVFLGDYIDRGSHSSEVIDFILSLRESKQVVTLMGNHEAMLLDFLRNQQSPAAAQFIFNGGGTTLASYGDGSGKFQIPDHHMEFFSNLLPFYEVDSYFMVHGGVPEIPLSKINMKKHGLYLMWAREPFLSSSYNWGKIIVHGHTPITGVSISANRINLDTGCVYNNKLSAIRLSDKKIFSAEKQKGVATLHLSNEKSSRRAVRFKGSIPIAVIWGDYKYAMETMDYNEFGLYARDITKGKKIKEGKLVTIKIQTTPLKEDVYQGIIVRSDKNSLGIQYAIKFTEEAVTKDSLDIS